MVGGWMFWIFAQSFLLLAIHWRGLAEGSDCWEACFEPEQRKDPVTGSDDRKDEYRDIMKLISNLRNAAATSGGSGVGASNGTAFLIDTTVPDSISDERKTRVLDLQKKLSQILAFAMPTTKSTNPGFFVKFDGTRSWYCYEWACLGRCDIYAKLETEFGNFTAETDKKDIDLLDDSCKVAANVMDIDEENLDADNHIACHGFTFNEMVVAMVNSPIQTASSVGCKKQDNAEQDAINALDGRGGFEEFMDDYSAFGDWCEQKFAKRAVVGTLYADRDEMDAFATVGNGNSWSGSTYLREDEDLLAALDQIATCMNTQCCADMVPAVPGLDTCIEYKDSALAGFSP